MARGKIFKPKIAEVTTEQVENIVKVIEQPKPTGLGKFKVLHPVLGYKVGDTFEASHHSVRFQLKHKSIVEV